MAPAVLVLSAGAIPPMRSFFELGWEEFSANWNVDVKASFLFCKAAIENPFPRGAAIVLISSGAGIGGSPLSGGYAGADLGPPDLDVDWLEPMPDSVMSDVADDGLSPNASYEQAEAVRLAFLACVQLLPARQRAIFLLHEVLRWSAAEVASAFAMSPQAANSLLQRARRTFDAAYQLEPKWAAASDLDQQLAERYAAALERRDLDAFVSLLRSDATLHMPLGAHGSAAAVLFERSSPRHGRATADSARACSGPTGEARSPFTHAWLTMTRGGPTLSTFLKSPKAPSH